MRPWRLAVGLLLVASLGFPALAQTDDDDLRSAQAELDRLRAESLELAAEYEEAWVADVEIRARINRLQMSIAAYGVELRRLREQIRERAVELYMNGAGRELGSLFLSPSPTDLDTRSEYLFDIRQQDQVMFNGLETLIRQLETATEDLLRDQEEQESTLARLDEVSADLNKRLEEGQATYLLLQQRREAEQARAEAEEQARAEAEEQARVEAEEQARAEAEAAAETSTTTPDVTPDATPGTTSTSITSTTTTSTTIAPITTTSTTTTDLVEVTDTTFVTTTGTGGGPGGGDGEETDATACPVNGFNTFTDTWGAARSGGRRHEGVDLLAARGTPVVAVTDGVVERTRNGGLGGITVWLRGDNGDEYYYAHLGAWAPELSVGRRVSAGQNLGVVGTTGNAPANIPHLHWEYHPGGYRPGRGSAVNPTPLARELCG